jgi:phosphoglucosamine mutase
MTKLFGTDGVRGTAGVFPLNAETIGRMGAALVRVLGAREPRLLVGRDTRESGSWIEQELSRGVAAEEGHLTSIGVVPTPAVAYLTRQGGFNAGLVISASHNPYQDNGIKVFSGQGDKFDERLESEIETLVADEQWQVPRMHARVETAELIDAYVAHLESVIPNASALRGLPVVIDCANGATTTLAARVFEGLGLDVTLMAAEPDGRNINLGCGSTHPHAMAERVVRESYGLGIAFDGDGDRAILADRYGRIVDGDAVLLMGAKYLKANGRLRGNGIVATVMSNIGLELALAREGIALYRCPVGDKYVTEELVRRNLVIGGEQSGHIVLTDYLFTGDGMQTAIFVLRILAETGRDLSDLAADLVTYPQVLLNVRVGTKRELTDLPEVTRAMEEVERRLGDQGRLLVRYSGTEPVLRIMIEGQDQSLIHAWAEEIGEAARRSLG